MGAVWLAEQLSVGRKRALKVMRGDIVHDQSLRERFAQEAKIGATIDSDHVVEVVAAGIDEKLDLPWLAMELLEGRDLAAVVLERGGLPLAEVAEIAHQLGHALAAAHAVDVVHRDLKPENVFLARSRRSGGAAFDVKVLDFGLAKVADDARTSSGAGSMLAGTPLYMAPEQTEVGRAATSAIDVWALGLIVYRTITGHYFWRSARDGVPSMTALMREVLLDPIATASVRAAEDGVAGRIPESFDAWLARCLEREPGRRFPDGGRACAALAPLLGGLAVPDSTPAGDAPRASTLPSRADPTFRSPAPRSSRPGLVVLHDDADLGVARVSDVVVVHWRATPTLASVERMGAALAQAVRELDGRPAIILPIIYTSSPAPEGKVRDHLQLTIEKQERMVCCAAYVVLGSGFQSASLRAIIAGMVLAIRPKHPTKVFRSVREAITWASTRTDSSGGGLSPDDLVEAIERFRESRPPSR